MTMMTKKPTFEKIPGVSEKRQLEVFNNYLKSLNSSLMDPYHCANYGTEGTVLAVDESGCPTEVRPVSVHNTLDGDDCTIAMFEELKHLPESKRADALRGLYRSVIAALRGYRYEVEMEVGYREEVRTTYAVGDPIHSDGDSFERGYLPSDVQAKVPVTIKITGVKHNRRDGEIRLLANLEISKKTA